MVINPRTIVGKNNAIQHSVTVGRIGDGFPIVGDNVFIGARAFIIGGVRIGNNVKKEQVSWLQRMFLTGVQRLVFRQE